MTMAHPDTFPHPPNVSSVVPYLNVCYQDQGSSRLVYDIDCAQPVWGQFLVITKEAVTSLPIAEVIVNVECKYNSFVCNEDVTLVALVM